MTEGCPVPHTRSADGVPPALRIARHGGLGVSLAFVRDAFGLLASVPDTADVVVTRMFGTPTVVLAHPAPVAEMLRDTKGTWIKDRMSQRAADVFGGGLLLSEGDTWKRQPDDAGADAFPYAAQVFQESLRLYPPAYALSRECVRDVTLGGVPITRGTVVVAPPWTLHRDARWHPEPLAFRPERWTPAYEGALPVGSYLPFGLGPRKCIGTRFATVEAVILLAGIARAFDWSSVDVALPPLQPAITCRPTRPVRIAVRRRAATG